MNSFLKGAGFLLVGFRSLSSPGLRRYVAMPLLINVLVFSLTGYLALSSFGRWLDALLPSSLGWLEWLLWPLAVLLLIVVVFYTFTLVANLIGSPFNDRLCETMTTRLGRTIERPAESWWRGLPAAVFGELRKWLYFGLLALVVLALWIFPLTTPLASLGWLALGVWMMAFEYLDYPLENAGNSFSEKHRWIRRHRWHALGFGAAVLGATLIPIVNFAVMPAAVAGATALWADREAA